MGDTWKKKKGSCLGCGINEMIKVLHKGMKLSDKLVDYDEALNKAERLITKASEERHDELQLADLTTCNETLTEMLRMLDGRLSMCAKLARAHNDLLRVFLCELKEQEEASSCRPLELKDGGGDTDASYLSPIARSITVIGRALEPYTGEQLKDMASGETDSSNLRTDGDSDGSDLHEQMRIERVIDGMARCMGLGTRAIKDGLRKMEELRMRREASPDAYPSPEELKSIRLKIAVPLGVLDPMKKIKDSVIYLLKKEREGALVKSVDSLGEVLKLCQQIESQNQEHGSSVSILKVISDIKGAIKSTIEAGTYLRNLNTQLGSDCIGPSSAADMGPEEGFRHVNQCGELKGKLCYYSLGKYRKSRYEEMLLAKGRVF